MRQDVNYITHHKNVFISMMNDDISCIDMSIYNALFLIWNRCDFDTELSINRNDVMKLAKVGNANTYTKSLRTLSGKGYIIYKPSNNPLLGSKVTIIRYDKGSDKTTAKSSDICSGVSTDKGSDTLYKQYNNLTNEQTNNILAYANNLSKVDLNIFLNSIVTKTKKGFDFRKKLIEYGFEKKLVDDWLSVRKTKKATNTETALNAFISEIESIPCNINEMLQIAVTQSWSGFKHKWVDNLKNHNNGSGNKGSNIPATDSELKQQSYDAVARLLGRTQ